MKLEEKKQDIEHIPWMKGKDVSKLFTYKYLKWDTYRVNNYQVVPDHGPDHDHEQKILDEIKREKKNIGTHTLNKRQRCI